MKKIRKNTFETNSSSTNSLSIGNSNIEIPMKLTILDQYYGGGRDFDLETTDEKFTVMVSLCDSMEEFFKLCYKMYKFGVAIINLPNPKTFKSHWDKINFIISAGGEIDDSYDELRSLLEDENEEDLKAFIFGQDSYVSGHNNEYDD